MITTKIINSKHDVDSIIHGIDTIISDCDGVIWSNKQPIEGASDFFKKMRSMGKRIVFATNNSTKSRESLLAELNKFGFEATIDEVIVPSLATTIALGKLSFTGKVFCLGSPVLRADIESAGFSVIPSSCDVDEDFEEDRLFKDMALDYGSITYDSDVSAVVIGMPHKVSTIKLIKACTYISKVSPDLVICTNTDFSFPGPNGLVIPITGSYVEFFEKATKRKMVCIGKPSKTFFDCIKIIHPTVNPSRTMVIGDTCDTDIAFGHNSDVKYTLLVGTGINSLDDVEKFALDGLNHLIPSHFVTSLKAFITFLSD
ncbi:glycerol-3-phosphate phosphatase-like [Tetranychus urticae]|uniref:4-nitrophenylphosphatase n=1 Tax=Tetranychus urticae TaxID=32264 RepID=T1L477_TETUR|nr:glycerol-3-phosphate phosphatase-like [Tetranychus urticae]XP_025018233.1 glycerol-3-phosphate phosphatase-like [Tetranychus urticae]